VAPETFYSRSPKSRSTSNGGSQALAPPGARGVNLLEENTLVRMHRLKQPTPFTRDEDFFRRDLAHENSALVGSYRGPGASRQRPLLAAPPACAVKRAVAGRTGGNQHWPCLRPERPRLGGENFGWPSINAVFDRYDRETVVMQRR
jgi:hypothetical protein